MIDAIKKIYFTLLKEKTKNLIPIFIVGSGHSGTSIMLRLLSNHEEIHGITYESYLFAKDDNADYQIIAQLLNWHRNTKRRNKKHLVEKTPSHVYHIKKIMSFCPNSKFIFMLRDGRNYVASMKERHGSKKSIQELCDYWISIGEIMEKHKSNQNVHICKLEELSYHPERELKKIFQHLQLKYDPKILDYHKISKVKYFDDSNSLNKKHAQNRNNQVNKALYKVDLEKYNKSFSDNEIKLMNDLLNTSLRKYGYK